MPYAALFEILEMLTSMIGLSAVVEVPTWILMEGVEP
jgi:hypothetical protein